MSYINGTLARLTILDNGTPVGVLYETESTLTLNANLTELGHKDLQGWLDRQPFGLKDWSIDCTRFYSDDNDNAPLNFNDAVALLVSGDQIEVLYYISPGVTLEGRARVNTDALTNNVSEASISTLQLLSDGNLIISDNLQWPTGILTFETILQFEKII